MPSWLPLKSEKTTLIDTGKLKREIRKRKNDSGQMESIEVYSLDALPIGFDTVGPLHSNQYWLN